MCHVHCYCSHSPLTSPFPFPSPLLTQPIPSPTIIVTLTITTLHRIVFNVSFVTLLVWKKIAILIYCSICLMIIVYLSSSWSLVSKNALLIISGRLLLLTYCYWLATFYIFVLCLTFLFQIINTIEIIYII